MKTVFTFLFTISLFVVSNTQEKQVETESVTLKNLISFIVDNYKAEQDSTRAIHSTFLIQSYADNFNSEDKVILQQAFRLLAERSTPNDTLSILSYSKNSGIILGETSASDIKKTLYAIEHPSENFQELKPEGIEVAYKHAEENYNSSARNTVVIVRLPNRDSVTDVSPDVSSQLNASKTKNNAVVLTAIALLPEIISVIKN